MNYKIVQKLRLIYEKFSLSEKHLVKGTLWNVLGNGFGKFAILISTIFVAKILGPDTFGKWGVIRSTSAVFSIVLGFGVGVTAVRYVAEYRDNNKEKVGGIIGVALTFALILGLLLTISMYFASNLITFQIIGDKSILIPLKLSSILLVFIAFNGVMSGTLAGLNSFSSIAFSNFIGGGFGTILIIYLSYIQGLYGLVLGYILYYFITAISLFYFFFKIIKKNKIAISLRDYRQHISIIINHNVPAILSGGIGGFAVWGVFAYVAKLNMGFTIIGVNNAAKIAQNAIMEIAAQIDIPIISYLSSSKENLRQKKINLYSPLIIGAVVILPFIYIPDLLGYLFLNSEFDNHDFILVVSLTMLTTYIMIYKRGMGRIIITKNLMWWGVYENLFWAILLITFACIFVEDYGSVGLAMAFALAYLVDLIVIKPFYYKHNLISKILIISKETSLIWIIVLLAPILVYTDVSLPYRIVSYLFGIVIHFFCLKRIYSKL